VQAAFPWGPFGPSQVHTAPSHPWEPAWPAYGREDQKRSLCFVYETLPTLGGWGGGGRACPTAEATQTPPRLAPRQATDTHMHARSHAGAGGPRGSGGQGEGEEKAAISPKPRQHQAKERVSPARRRQGAQRCREHPCPTPGHCAEHPRHSARSPLTPKTKFFLSVSRSPPRGSADLRSSDGGTWLRWVP